MASNSEIALQSAISAVERAFARLDAAAQTAAEARAHIAADRAALEAEFTARGQQQVALLESTLAESYAESEFLRADNLRLSNQLSKLQKDYLALQQTASHTVGRLDATVAQLDLILEH